MWKTFRYVYICCVVSSVLCDDGDSRAELGYPKGLMSVCLGSTKPAEIPKSQLRYLFFVVQGSSGGRRKYSYWDAKNIVRDPDFDLNKDTVVVALGYLDSTNFMIAGSFAREYSARGYNVILVDNQRFATVHYYLATRLMRPVGKHVAEVLVQLTQSGLNPKQLELVGFSLGAQTVSYIAKNYRTLTGKNITTITALEPSGPCFRSLGPNDRLDASDADFVQVIHTNIDGYGMANKMGHVDFYVNGGEYQPSDLNMYPCTSTCSHFRVLTLWFVAMNNPDSFVGLECDTIQQARDDMCFKRKPLERNLMGLSVDRKKHGIFYLATSLEYPYYLGEDGLKSDAISWNRVTDVNKGNDTIIYT